MFLAMLRRDSSPSYGRRRRARVPTQRTKLSHYGHGCGAYVKKPLWLRWHACPCGIGPEQRDLYSAFLAAHRERADLPSLSCPGPLGACGDATAEQQERPPSNVRMRGRSCPNVWVFPVPERVCPNVLATPGKRLASRAGTRKRWQVSKNLPALRRERLRKSSSAYSSKAPCC